MADLTIGYLLPFPPSCNTYWRRNGNRYFIAPSGVTFRNNVAAVVLGCDRRGLPLKGELYARLDLYPPDRRERDADNYCKGVWDALQKVRVFERDSQIKSLQIEMHPPTRPGRCVVTLAQRG